MIYIKLLISFFKIGIFCFGGGYAMIPLIQAEIECNKWMTPSEFIDIIAVAEMTPGPVAVNTATYVGYKTAGITGGLFATLGVSLPSLLIILFVSGIFFKYRKHPVNLSIFYGIRPAVSALIASAAIIIARASLVRAPVTATFIHELMTSPLKVLDVAGIIIMVAAFFASVKLKTNPIFLILASGAAGFLLYLAGI